MAVVLARLRMPLIYLGLAAILVDSFLWDLPRWPLLALLAVAFAIYLRLGTVRRPPVEVALPVAGRWLAFNSPADRVPSHHLHAYGQTYAIDPVHDPADGGRPGLAWWPPALLYLVVEGMVRASCSAPDGSSATTSCSTWATGSTPPWPTCAAARSWCGLRPLPGCRRRPGRRPAKPPAVHRPRVRSPQP
jgi:hypothetical protein